MKIRKLFLFLSLAAGCVHAQHPPDHPDWQEVEVPPPPAFDIARLVPFEVGGGSAIRWGIDPATITITEDRVVRYVVVASGNGGAVQGMYEGVRCATSDFKTYARHNSGVGWKAVENAQWRPLWDNMSRHALVLAQQGLCRGRSPAINAQAAIESLKGRGELSR